MTALTVFLTSSNDTLLTTGQTLVPNLAAFPWGEG